MRGLVKGFILAFFVLASTGCLSQNESAIAVSSGSEFSKLNAAKTLGVSNLELRVGSNLCNPLGCNLENMSFSWSGHVLSSFDGKKQKAYRIIVAESLEDLNSEKSLFWDSGKVESSQSAWVKYKGKKLESRQRLYWKVAVWDESGNLIEGVKPAIFETGLLKNSDWQAKWIRADFPARTEKFYKLDPDFNRLEDTRKVYEPAYFRKEFKPKHREIKHARLYATSRGIYEIYLNGKKVGSDHWSPGWTDYNKRIQTYTYDVGLLLNKDGANAIGAIVADGWYSGRLHKYGYTQFYGERPELLLQLEITYKDGSRELIASDETWKTSKGAYTFADIYDGEEYDARKEPVGWKCANFDDSSWEKVVAGKVEKTPLLEPRRDPAIRVMKTLPTVSVKEISSGVYLFDLGQNMVGAPRIKIPAEKGRRVKIRYAEILENGKPYTNNYRSARSTDYYTCAGNGVEEYTPRFTFHGFRYVELSGLPSGLKLSSDTVQGLVMYNSMRQTGSFHCADQKINKLQSNIVWSQRGNFFSVPTDCPQRDERLGWTGDAQVFTPTAAFNMDVYAFYTKWLQDMRDAQKENGMIPHIVPNCRVEVDSDKKPKGGSPAWDDAAVVCPWEIYLAYGDPSVLEQNYEMMKKRVSYQMEVAKNFIAPDEGYGDWHEPFAPTRYGTTSRPLVGTAFMVKCTEILSKTAKILGREDDAKKYAELNEKIKDAFVKEFVVNYDTCELSCTNQTPYILALGFDILPENLRPKAVERLKESLKRSENSLRTGFVGTPLICPVLTRFGLQDEAFALLFNDKNPSWLHQIENGATTMWERWDGYTKENGFAVGGFLSNSFNHYAYGAIGQWLYKDVAGIGFDEKFSGYKNIIFAPHIDSKLNSVFAFIDTSYGHTFSGWKLSNDTVDYRIEIPFNCTGTVVIPKNCDTSLPVLINGKPVKLAEPKSSNECAQIENLESGAYHISFKLIKDKS